MNEFSSYLPEDIIGANLREAAERSDMIWEQESAHLRELALELTSDTAHGAELFRTLAEHRLQKAAPPPSAPAYSRTRARLLSCMRNVFLCLELRRETEAHTPLLPENFFPEAEEVGDGARGRIVYQRSSYADDAYLRFAALLDEPRACYAHSFTGVCEDVYNGLCEFGLLPLESSSEGQLTGFSRLIDRYDLKIAATCDILATDRLRRTKFALLRKDTVPFPAPTETVEHFFEFSSPLGADPSSAELLGAAALCGLTLHRMDCRAPDENSPEEERRVHYVFRTDRGDLTAFLLYLSMEAPSCRPTGIYFHL